jgi:hypothetical protein
MKFRNRSPPLGSAIRPAYRVAFATLLNDMDMSEILAELRSEQQRLDEAILVLQRLATGGRKRRGRPPKWIAAATSAVTVPVKQSGKRTVSLAARKRMAAAQRKRWAKVRRGETGTATA